MRKGRTKKFLFDFGARLTLCILSLGLLFPIIWMVLTSFKTQVDSLAIPPKWFFVPTLEHYNTVLHNGDFLQGFRNSFIIAMTSLAITLLVGIPASYALARIRFKRKKDLAFWILSTRMAPPVGVLIPFYLMFRTFRLNDTITALVIMHITINLALVIWMMRGFFKDLPGDLEDAALIDGCTPFGAFFRVMLPLTLNGIIATAILGFVFSWNELMFAIVLTGANAKTAPAAVYNFITYNEIKWGQLTAAGVIVLIPVIVFIAFAQNYLVRGLTLGAVKE